MINHPPVYIPGLSGHEIPPTSKMHSLSPATTKLILSLMDAGHSAHHISAVTGVHTSTISRLCSKHCSHLAKAIGGRPAKLTPTYVHHAICLLTSGKADTAVQVSKVLSPISNQALTIVQVTRALSDISNQSLCAETVCLHLKKAGLKSAVKQQKSNCHCRERLDFAIAHKERATMSNISMILANLLHVLHLI